MRGRERILATFRGDNVDRVVWQPRLEHWYCVIQTKETLSDEYQSGGIDKTAAESGFTPLMAEQLLRIYDDLDASIRYTGRCPATGKGFLEFEMAGDIEVDIEENDDETVRRISTPKGNLREMVKKTELGCSKMNVEYLLESTDDIPVMEYVLRNREVNFNHDAYQNSKEFLDGRGVVQFFLPRSPLQRTMLDYMGMERTLINLTLSD